MARASLEVADVFGRFVASYLLENPTSSQQRRVISAIMACRTAALGGHLERCDGCAHERNAYNSCRDRQCPKCGSLARDQWVEQRKADVLPVPYFHLVFTLPEILRPVAMQNQRTIYNMLFQSVAATLQQVAANPDHLGARIGFMTVLHTWTQQLQYHPHIHCVVPGGGISPDGDAWVSSNDKYFLPVKVLSETFRTVFMGKLRAAYRKGELTWHGDMRALLDPDVFNRFLQPAWKHNWVVNATAPFAGPEAFIDYIGRYTHRIGLSNHRLVSHDDATVTFTYRNKQRNADKFLTLPGHEFVRRFLLHVLPPHFVRLRHYGYLANACRTEQVALCRRLLKQPESLPDPPLIGPVDWKIRVEVLTGLNIHRCPMCSDGVMRNVQSILPRKLARTSTQLAPPEILDSS